MPKAHNDDEPQEELASPLVSTFTAYTVVELLRRLADCIETRTISLSSFTFQNDPGSGHCEIEWGNANDDTGESDGDEAS